MTTATAEKVVTGSKVQWVELDKLVVDPEVQRKFNPKWVSDRVEAFDPDKLGFIVVNRRPDGKMYVVDGQHRAALVRTVLGNDQKMEAQLYSGMDIADEAKTFLARNDRISIRPLDTFRVRVAARDTVAVDILRIVREHGFAISDQARSGNIVAVGALQNIYNGAKIATEQEGALALARTLHIITEAWGTTPAAVQGTIIQGIGVLCLRYGSSLDDKRMIGLLARRPGGASGIMGAARTQSEIRSRPVGVCVAGVLVDLYNKGRRTTEKLENWWA